MKVTLEKNYRAYYTLDDLDRAKAVIASEKAADDFKPEDWAEIAIREALRGTDDYMDEILTATAETAKNSGVWDAYDEGTKDMDVWIRCTAKTARCGFIEIGTYLSDLWKVDSITPIYDRMYIRYFGKETRLERSAC